MRIVFFGSPAAALPALENLRTAGHDVPLVVTQPDRPAGRGRRLTACPVKAYAREHGIESYDPEKIRRDPAALDRLKAAAADVHVVVAYGQILPGPLLALPRYGSLNLHFSLLPKYRGASPVTWAIWNGEAVTGITIFRLNAKMDEGDILAAEEAPILPDDTTGSLETRLAGLGAGLLLRTLERLDALVPVPQDHSLATLAPKLKKEFGRVDWSRDAESVDRQVRALLPWPTAYTFFRGERMILLHGHSSRPDIEGPPAPPGTILEAGRDGLRIACGAGTEYRLTRLQVEGKKPLEASLFVLGGRISVGDVLRDSA